MATQHLTAAARRLIFITLLAALSACGGGGGGGNDSQPAVKAETVDVYGDSIAVTEAANVAPLVAPHRVRSHAVSGSTLQQAVAAGWLADAHKSDAAAIVLAYGGTNDALMRPGYYSPAEYRAALAGAARAIVASGKGLVIETAPRVLVELAPAGRYNNVGADQYAEQARQVAREVGAVLCDRNARPSTPDVMPDGVHPVGQLAAQNAQALADCVRAALR